MQQFFCVLLVTTAGVPYRFFGSTRPSEAGQLGRLANFYLNGDQHKHRHRHRHRHAHCLLSQPCMMRTIAIANLGHVVAKASSGQVYLLLWLATIYAFQATTASHPPQHAGKQLHSTQTNRETSRFCFTCVSASICVQCASDCVILLWGRGRARLQASCYNSTCTSASPTLKHF